MKGPRRTLLTCSGAHAVHDGFTDLLTVLYPLLQAQFGLGYATIGALKALYSTSMAAGQIPSGALAGRVGAVRVLWVGTALAAVGLLVAGMVGSFAAVLLGLLLAGLGASTQHPVAASLVAAAYPDARSRSALGTYNFSGDIGKMLVPAAFALLAATAGWEMALVAIGVAGLLFAVSIPRTLGPAHAEVTPADEPAASRAPLPWRYWLLFGVHVADGVVRAGTLVFLPFLVRDRGADIATIGLALSVLFAGGACGKLAFGWIGARLGVVRTVVLTAFCTASLVAVLAFVPLPVPWMLVLLPVLGLTLNGTSSVLYGTVPEFVPAASRTHAFAVFYTGGSAAGALAPLVLGVLADATSVVTALATVAGVALLAAPLVLAMRRAFHSH